MEYIINKNTIYMECSDNGLIVYEINKRIYIDSIKITDLVNNSCLFYGSSYIGRKNASKFLLNITAKIPIIINEKSITIIFPLYSEKNKNNYWLIFNKIFSYKEVLNGVEITFKNRKKVVINCSYYVFHHQYLKCCELFSIFCLRN